MKITLILSTAFFVFGGATLASDEAEWDIQDRHASTSRFRATFDEGTWMSVDVSPDGETIVFDLLGDLFILPLEGGEAEAISEGAAWDQDPRWSPDGTQLMYVSDRGGNQEIWIRDMDSGESTQLTEGEPERFAEAAWAPDGQHVVARKRITDTRSIGMCELWLLDVAGGDGVQLTETSSLAFPLEPDYSNDGEWLYYSAAPSRFAYNKDPNGAIYNLYAMQLSSGEVRRLTGEAGSAFRPTVNPVTGQVAIMRRRATETVMEIFDPTDGSRTPFATGFDHDNQEGFGLNSLYPHVDWTPDGQSMIVWARGGLWSIDASTGDWSEIPFTVDVDHRLTERHRATRRIGVEDMVRSSMIRWPQVSPDGSQVLFEALGRLWIQRIDNDEANALTDGERMPLHPSWSPDGSSVLYATWHDEEQGDVRLQNIETGDVRVLTTSNAQYRAPLMNEAGDKVLWLRGSGAPLRGLDTHRELWFRLEMADMTSMPSATLEVQDITSYSPGWGRGHRVYWAPDDEGFFVVRDDPSGQPNTAGGLKLDAIDFQGRLIETIAKWGSALEVEVSQDGRSVAWVEGYRVYSSELPTVGGVTYTLGSSQEPVPRTSWSESAGGFPHFSGETVSYASGRTFHFGDETIELVAELPRPVASDVTAYTDVRVLTMTNSGVLEHATVLVEGERIEAVGEVSIPDGATVVDGSGMTIMPGLIDVHGHLHFGTSAHPQRSWAHEINLAYGVTTVHDPSADNDTVFATAERIRAGLQLGPRVYSTGSVLYGAKSRGRSVIDSYEDAEFHINRLADLGAISVKSYQQPSRRQRQWLLSAAREVGLNVYTEGGGDFFSNIGMAIDGHTGVEHSLPVAPIYRDVAEIWARTGTGYTPTLLVAYGGISGERFFYQSEELLSDEKFLRFTPEDWVDRRLRRLGFFVRDNDWFYQSVAESAGVIAELGGNVQLGGHGQVQGIGPHWELWALAGGMGNEAALHAATFGGAHYLGFEQDLGSIEEGKLADILLIEGNPLENIRDSLNIVEVVQGGVRYNGETLEVMR